MPPVRIGVTLQPQQATFAQLRDAWLRAEELGADTVFTWDHFFPLYGDPDGPHFECWSILAAMAESTERVHIGPLVSCSPYRNPNLIADIARTIDHISGGRVILGLGSGWNQRDFDEYGYEFGTVADRLRWFREALPIIRARLGKLNPGPVRGTLPILIGGKGEKVMLRLVAEHADAWHGFADPPTFRHKCEVIDRHCADVGRDPGQIERIAVLGDGEIDSAQAYVDAGATHLVVETGGPDYDFGPLGGLLRFRDAGGEGRG
jgi:probable F420-dependent oxidoreductase